MHRLGAPLRVMAGLSRLHCPRAALFCNTTSLREVRDAWIDGTLHKAGTVNT